MNNIKGLETLVNRLNNLGGNVDETVYKSMQKQGQLVKSEAKLLCPFDTGDLVNS